MFFGRRTSTEVFHQYVAALLLGGKEAPEKTINGLKEWVEGRLGGKGANETEQQQPEVPSDEVLQLYQLFFPAFEPVENEEVKMLLLY